MSYDKVFLVTNDTSHKLPNLTGWSRKDAITLLDLLDVEYNIEGNGFVTSQSINADTILTGEEILTIILSDKYGLSESVE